MPSDRVVRDPAVSGDVCLVDGLAVTWRDLDCCRVIFSEADGMPGLVVDRYGPVLVTQVGTVGMERLRGTLYPLLLDVLRDAGEDVRAIYERCDGRSRLKEGLALRSGWWKADPREGVAARSGRDLPPTSVTINEGGVIYVLDLAESQKTGFFLDQKYNRRAVARLACGRRMLDCFCHVGSFGLSALCGGAAYVRCVDVSAAALDLARRNARLNGFAVAERGDVADGRDVGVASDRAATFGGVGAAAITDVAGGVDSRAKRVRSVSADIDAGTGVTGGRVVPRAAPRTNAAAGAASLPQNDMSGAKIAFTCANVLEYLPALRRDHSLLRAEGGPFDLIVLDPPAFAKSRSAVRGAIRGYREINAEAMRLLPRGGYLATCSCSHHMTTDLLCEAISEAAHSVNVQLKQIEQRQQAPDHPILWGFPQSHYLDFFIFQVV